MGEAVKPDSECHTLCSEQKGWRHTYNHTCGHNNCSHVNGNLAVNRPSLYSEIPTNTITCTHMSTATNTTGSPKIIGIQCKSFYRDPSYLQTIMRGRLAARSAHDLLEQTGASPTSHHKGTCTIQHRIGYKMLRHNRPSQRTYIQIAYHLLI